MRPTLNQTMMGVAMVLARRATCKKLAVGCVVVDLDGRILGTGYNGVPRGLTHCTDAPCPGVGAPAGSDTCEAVHAEQNAMFGVEHNKVYKCYVTHAPCMRCTKLLLNTTCMELVFPPSPFQGVDLWTRARRYVTVLEMP